jgi:hypothetical protein
MSVLIALRCSAFWPSHRSQLTDSRSYLRVVGGDLIVKPRGYYGWLAGFARDVRDYGRRVHCAADIPRRPFFSPCLGALTPKPIDSSLTKCGQLGFF